MRLLLSLTDSGSVSDVVVEAMPGISLGEVRDQLPGSGCPLFAGSTRLEPDQPVGLPPLVHGALLGVGEPVGTDEPRAGLRQLRVVGGPSAGSVHLLGPGQVRLGRGAEADVRLEDPDISRLHAVLTVSAEVATVADIGSTNGGTVDGVELGDEPVPMTTGAVLRLGESSLVLSTPDEPPLAVHPDAEGLLAVNRPPRLHLPPVRGQLSVPVAPARPRGVRLPLIAALLPIPLGVAMVAITHNLSFALFLLLSPVLAMGSWANDKFTGRGEHRRATKQHAQDLHEHEQELANALAGEQLQRRREAPDPATVLQSARAPSTRLWERRPADSDALLLRLGTADLPARLVLIRTDGQPAAPPVCRAVPVTVDMPDVGVLGVAGPRARAQGLARSLVAQLGTLHSPRDLDLIVLGDGRAERDEWRWLRLLPHLSPRFGEDCTARVGFAPADVARRVRELLARLDVRADAAQRSSAAASSYGPATVALLDGARELRSVPGLARLLAEGPAVGMYAICLADDADDLPAECGATAYVTGDVGTRLTVTRTGQAPITDVLADLVDTDWATRLARSLAPLRDVTPDASGASLPAAARLLDLLPAEPTPQRVAADWHAGGRSTTATVGVGADGPYAVDLCRDGPHALVAGTTGSGKSELLQTMIASLALANRPDELTFLLVDYKGGSAFKDCVSLPHTVGMVTDLDGHLTERALASLDAELKRRERVLAGAGCKDLEDYQYAVDAGTAPRLPRLVMVIDEFAALVAELPTFVDGLVDIARRGRSLGVHLVLATQRPGGVVSGDIRANTNLRIALRMTDAAESADVLDRPDAALISPHTPGRAFCRSGSGALAPFQSARVGGSAAPIGRQGPTVLACSWEHLGAPLAPVQPTRAGDGPTDLARLVAVLGESARLAGIASVPSPWLPALPAHLPLSAVSGPSPLSVPVGLADLPAEQQRRPFLLDLEHGSHLLAAGGPRSGRTSLLRTVAGSVAATCPVPDVHVYAFDCASGGLLPITALPHAGAVVGREETDRGDRVLARLAAEVARRQELLGRCGYGSVAEQRAGVPAADRLPYLLLLLDGWDGFLSAYEEIDHGRPVDALLRLLREGPAVGLRAVVTGDRSTLTGRLASVLPTKLLLRMADPSDYALGGLLLRQVPQDLPPGRGLLPGDVAVEVQIALLAEDPAGPAQVAELGRLAATARDQVGALPGAAQPFRVDPLPAQVSYDDAAARVPGSPAPSWVLLGLGGDELAPVGVDLAAEGPAFVIAGRPRTGRSTVLLSMARWLLTHGVRVALVTARRSPLRDLKGLSGVVGLFGPADSAELADAMRLEDGPVVVLVDDSDALLDAPVEQTLLDILAVGARMDQPWVVVAAGSLEELAAGFRGLSVELRKHKTGLLLCPTGPLDGDLLGVRLARGLPTRPGGGILAVKGEVSPVQVAV